MKITNKPFVEQWAITNKKCHIISLTFANYFSHFQIKCWKIISFLKS